MSEYENKTWSSGFKWGVLIAFVTLGVFVFSFLYVVNSVSYNDSPSIGVSNDGNVDNANSNVGK